MRPDSRPRPVRPPTCRSRPRGDAGSDGERGPVPLTGAGPHTTALDWLRGRPDRRQGGVRRGGVRRLRRPARPPAPGRRRVDRGQRLPAPGRRPRRAGGRHRRGPRLAGRPAPGAAGDGVRGGSQCGYCTPGFVCSMAAEYYRPDRARAGPRMAADARADAHERGPNGFDLHAVCGNLCRCTGYRPIRDAAFALGAPADGDPLAARARGAAPPPPAPPGSPRRQASSSARPTSTRRSRCSPRARTRRLVAGSTDWGVEVNLRGARAALAVAVDHLPELRGRSSADDASRSAPRSRSPRSRRARPDGCRCSPSCSRSSPPG